jgi:hypothetical protein
MALQKAKEDIRRARARILHEQIRMAFAMEQVIAAVEVVQEAETAAITAVGSSGEWYDRIPALVGDAKVDLFGGVDTVGMTITHLKDGLDKLDLAEVDIDRLIRQIVSRMN